MFSVGKAVEFSFERYDPRDVWYPATILQVFANGSFSVEYHKSNVSGKVTVNSFQIRPCPPRLKNTDFCLLEKVDTFYESGWWSGVIIKMLADNRYVVFLKPFNLEKEVSSLELRPHMNWKNGNWYTSLGFLISPDQGDDANCNAKVNQRTVELDSSGTKGEASKEKTSCSLNSHGDQIAQSIANDGTLLQLQVLQKEQISTSSPSLTPSAPNTKEFETLTDEIPSEGTCGNVSISQCGDQLSGNPFNGMSTRRKRQKTSEQDISVSDVQIVQGKLTELQVDGAELPIQGKEAAGNVAENNEADAPIVMGLECIYSLRSSRTKTSHHMDGKECSDPLSGQKQHVDVIESEQLVNAESIQKKRRGRPRKSVVNTFKGPAPLIDNLQNVDTEDEMIIKDCTTNESGLQTKIINAESQSKDITGASEGRNAEHIDVEKVITEVPSNSCDSPPLTNGSKARIDNGNGTLSSEIQRLPFVKNTLLWATIESMDVFQRIPQKPHFRPLEHVNESCREGLAIGYMVTFSTVVDRVCKLQLDDPRRSIEEMLETIDELGGQGFDVQHIQERLNEMLLFKDKQQNLELQSVEMESEIVKHNTEKTEVDEEIEEMKKQIAELEEKVSWAISKKEAKDVEIASLQTKMDDIREEIRSARSDYEDLASKPLM